MTPEKLHLGCGKRFIPGMFHVDALDYEHVDHIGPIDRLDFIDDGSVSFIYACHVLEHFGRHETGRVLDEWHRVLKPGGVLRLSVPDFGACAKLYMDGRLDDINQIRGLISGGQRDEYDYHKQIFDAASLEKFLKDARFSEVREWDWRSTEHSDVDDYSQAYLPHMDKENGILVSLNLEAVK